MGLEKLINKLERLDLNRIERGIAESEKELIIKLNTEDQLFDKGIDSLGRDLASVRGRGYTANTLRIKASKGQRTDHVTLKDTEDFYNTWDVTISNDGFEPTADPIKDDTNLFDEWGDEITGLTDESLDKYIEQTLTKRQDGFRKGLL